MSQSRRRQLPIGQSFGIVHSKHGDVAGIHRQSQHSYRWRFLATHYTRSLGLVDASGTTTTFRAAQKAVIARVIAAGGRPE